VSILETAADKFVALTRARRRRTRRFSRRTRSTLGRHLHDLREHYDAADVATLAREIMSADAAAYSNQFPAYREDPMRETLWAVDGLTADAGYMRQYEDFQRVMVYGDKADYRACIETLRELSERLVTGTSSVP
jgi:hypothetical protein